ncbi:PREDICTED: protein YLS9-like [Fragaria vesca subsp. vesca]|uniref:protein YLS9-like n=1 Tax=Fragaria vesca subsp. vesca TaxID=101020 RepID=UPI0002C366A9|nr:PREDICTED: protein YLS9-like [Fragaria vesca subsp. vesca]
MSGCRFTCCFWIYYNLILCFSLSFMIFGFIFLPQEPKFTITNATLTQFNFNSSNNTLDYNLTLNMTIRNPNKRVGIYYRRIQVIGDYRKKRFALVTLNTLPFYQGHKNTTELHQVVVQGSQPVKFGKREVSQFTEETASGIYSIKVQLALRIKARYGKFTSRNYQPYRKIDCKLNVPLSFNETSIASGFKATRCENVYFFTDPDSD